MRLAGLIVALLLVSCGSLKVNRIRETRELPLRVRREMHASLAEMAMNWDAMSRGHAHKRREAENAYEAALGRFVSLWCKAQEPRFWSSGVEYGTESGPGRFVVAFDEVDAKRRGASPHEYDDLLLPERSTWRKDSTLALRPGLGLPVVGRVQKKGGAVASDLFLPPKGGNYALTALLEMGQVGADGVRHCRLRLHDSLNTEVVPAPGGVRQLAADYTAPKALALSRKTFGNVSLQGLFCPGKALKDCHLYCLDAYDPKRIPVVFVHGLVSDPHVWLNAVNAISMDPLLRRRYQPWYFLYPTAVGVPYAAARLRESLLLARETYDPEHDDPGMQRMVLVGHSMGGLVSRLQVTDSGDAMWSSLFNKPLEQMQVSEPVREKLSRALFVKPLPFVERVIFIATPHRGSKLASLNVVRLLTGLVRMPFDSLTMVNELLKGNADTIHPQISEWGVFSFMSVGMLSDKHPLLQGLDRTRPTVTHHSVIGNSGLTWVKKERSSDGAVHYRSSHLDSAATEKMVPYLHGCSDKPQVVQEITRVLRLHLKD